MNEMNKEHNDISKRNAEGYPDLTAYEAIKSVEDVNVCKEDEDRFNKLLRAIFTICELSGFHIEGRIIVKDNKTGKIWR